MPRLIVIKGANQGKQYELEGSIVCVGRDAGSDIRLHDTEVSRRHAELRRLGDSYSLVDKGSANGTFVNSSPVTETVLQPGDRVQFGQSIMLYSAGRPGKQDTDLADRISMIARQEQELSSAIVKSVDDTEGGRLLAHPQQADTAWLQGALANLAVLYEAVHTTSHILDLDQLLEKIMELVFRTIEADRGCVMLHDQATGSFEPKAVRWRQARPAQEKMTISRTIMDHVLKNRQGVLVSDASRDDRFNSGLSIVQFGIREAICVPMKGRHETLGVLYLDTSIPPRDLIDGPLVPTRFNEDHLKLAIAIAHQAALAVEDTRYHEAMVQAERLAAIGQAVAALSHHIKNILQGLKSGSEILKLGLEDKDDALLQQGWKIVEKNQGKIYDLVMDMLGYSKEREPAIEVTDLNAIVRDVLELQASRAREIGVRIDSNLAADLAPVPVDPEGFHRALLNIVVNALDALEGRAKSRITVETSIEADGEWVQCVVEDNGPGISAGRLEEVFKPFVSDKGARGTGLGLAVSRKVLREHGGDITITSERGKGCRFTLRLPTKSPLTPEPGQTSHDMTIMTPPPADD